MSLWRPPPARAGGLLTRDERRTNVPWSNPLIPARDRIEAVMDDEGTSGVILDSELPLSSLARTLKMAEVEVYRRMLDLVERVRVVGQAGGQVRTSRV